jgi:hypothetical protein
MYKEKNSGIPLLIWINCFGIHTSLLQHINIDVRITIKH